MNIEILHEFCASTDYAIVFKRRKRSKRYSYSYRPPSTSLPPSSPAATTSTCTEEDQDMANCLILLARSAAPANRIHRTSHKKPRPPPSDATISQPPILPRPPEIKPKIHQCSLCGSQFGSGQALGGHMRKHRSETTPRNNSPTAAVLELDLNQPAVPEVEDDHQTSGEFNPSGQHLNLVLGTTAATPLVDCHY